MFIRSRPTLKLLLGKVIIPLYFSYLFSKGRLGSLLLLIGWDVLGSPWGEVIRLTGFCVQEEPQESFKDRCQRLTLKQLDLKVIVNIWWRIAYLDMCSIYLIQNLKLF